jgi:hypothetical protein
MGLWGHWTIFPSHGLQEDIEIEGSDLSLEVSQIMVKFLNDCLQQIHADQKIH